MFCFYKTFFCFSICSKCYFLWNLFLFYKIYPSFSTVFLLFLQTSFGFFPAFYEFFGRSPTYHQLHLGFRLLKQLAQIELFRHNIYSKFYWFHTIFLFLLLLEALLQIFISFFKRLSSKHFNNCQIIDLSFSSSRCF